MKNYIDLRTEPDKFLLPSEVRSADNIEQMQELAKLRFETALNEYGWKDKITEENSDGEEVSIWEDDATDQTNERLKQAVRFTIAALATEALYQQRDMSIQEYQFGPVRFKYRKNHLRNPWKLIKPFVNDSMWMLS